MAAPDALLATSVEPLQAYYDGLVESLALTKWVGHLLVARLSEQMSEVATAPGAQPTGVPPEGFGMQVHLLVSDLSRGIDIEGKPLEAGDQRRASAAMRDQAGVYLGTITAARVAYGSEYATAVHDWLLRGLSPSDQPE